MGNEGFTFTAQKRGSSAFSSSAATLPTTAAAATAITRSSPRQSNGTNNNRPINKTVNNLKLTLLCGLVTILVMRGTIGLAGHSSASASDSDDAKKIADELADEAARVIAAVRSEEPDEAETVHLNTTYSLGPKITDWDDKRQTWLRQNPSFPNLVNGRPRVLLVTGSQPKPCDNPVGDHYLIKAVKNKIDYCRIHGIEIVYGMAPLDPVLDGFWVKFPLVRKLMLSHPEVEWIWWMDSDAMFTDMAFEVPFTKYEAYNMVVHGFPDLLLKQKSWIALNAGVFLLRNCQWSLDLLDRWIQMGPKGAVREAAGRLLAATLKGRPAFEADDQSALIYLLLTERERWMGKVFVESSYFLHGYWVEIVDRYEEMMEKYRPGLGDERWPFVTHFVGCKPCGKYANYALDRCLKSMERAFNFADNQVLELYGLRHRGLLSPKVKKIRNETDTPLEVVDRFDIRHSAMKSH